MELKIDRRWVKRDYIVGRLYVDGSLRCNTLEPPLTRSVHPAIAPGTYSVSLRHSPRFGAVRAYLDAVPGRSGILLHEGNTVADTRGCVLLGVNDKVGWLSFSKSTTVQLVADMLKARERGEAIVVTIC